MHLADRALRAGSYEWARAGAQGFTTTADFASVLDQVVSLIFTDAYTETRAV
jgi:hypothetical protein